MTNSTVTLRQLFQAYFRFILLTSSIITAAHGPAMAQRSATDGSTPLALAPGAPAGSYALSGFETVNAYNGSLSFRLPLLQIGGRGNAGYTLNLPLEAHWRTVHKSNDVQMIELPVLEWWKLKNRRYGAGQLEGRVGVDPDHPCPSVNRVTTVLLTRLTFTAPDGTEYELRDQLTGGRPQTYYCGGGGPYPSRGTIFVTADGTAATFISDTTILDDGAARNPSGYLSLRDGTRYRITQGDVIWLRDRNGNQLNFSYAPLEMTVTDSLNRKVNVKYADFSSRFYDEITYRGYGGSQRNIRVNYAPLQSVLRTNRAGDLTVVQPAAKLFPQLTGSASTDFNPHVISSVLLPDGVQQYQFLYNVYGELARATLPTGGAFEYDFGNGAVGEDATGVIWSAYSLPEIYRRILRRRVYDSGSALESLTTYSRPEVDTGGYVQIDHFTHDQTTLLARERHYFYGAASASFNEGPLDYSPWLEGKEYQTEYYSANGQNLLKKVTQTWDQRSLNWWIGNPNAAPPNNPYITETLTTLVDSGQVMRTSHINPQSGQAMIDQFNNVTDTWIYDYNQNVSGSLLAHSHTDYLAVNNGVDYTTRTSLSSPHLLSLPTRQSIYDAAGLESARSTFEYDNYAGTDSYHASLKDWPALTGIGISGLDPSFTSSYSYRGNLTATTRYLLNNNQITGSITGYTQYDLAGSVVKSIDARSTPENIIASTFSYDDCFGFPDGNARGNSVPEGLTTPSLRTYAFPTLTTNALGHKVFTQFDYYLARPVDVEDANGTVYSGFYDDVFDRPTKLIKAANRDTSFQSQTLFNYDDIGRNVTTTSDLRLFTDQVLKEQLFYDGLGRTVETRQYEGGSNYIAARKVYDALGRVSESSNPFRPWKNEVAIWNISTFDGLGRAESLRTADGATATVSYSGNEVITTDQIGKKKRTVNDALGRLTKVYEDPGGVNWLTTYTYDALDNLKTVAQAEQTRTFVYDTLGRMTAASNPESGISSYTYDNNGNPLTRTDARGIITAISYDALNRPVLRSYQNDPAATPPVSYFYDNQALPSSAPAGFARGSSIGRAVAVIYGGSSSSTGDYYGYDVLGRSVLKVQRTGNMNYQTSAAYDVSGRTTSVNYPSGHTLAYNYDAAGRLGDRDAQTPAMTGNLGDGVMRTYTSGISYSSWNSLAQEKLGTDTPIYNKLFYNSRGQLAEIRESTNGNNTSWNRGAIINHYSDQCWGMCAGQGMTDNNGNLKRQDTYIPNNDQMTSYVSWADAYSYDALNRLTQVHESTGNNSVDWQQAYSQDRWGNRTINQPNTFGANIPKPNYGVNVSNNRVTAPSGYRMDHDVAGNLIYDDYTGAGQRSFDAENRMISAQGFYTYDGEGHRIKRTVNNLETWQVFGIDDELVAEYAAQGAPAAPQKEYGYRNGQLLVTASPSASGTSANVALAANGATAVASSYFSNPNYGTYLPGYVIDGSRRAINGAIWLDNTYGAFPDWIEVDFSGSKTISEIDVVTQQDDNLNPVEPTLTQTFSNWGITDFEVQYWSGSNWVTVPGASVTGNNKVWRRFTFSSITTNKIRVVINNAADHVYSRVVEIEAWASAMNPPAATNFALGTNGGTAVASSYFSNPNYGTYLPGYVIDGSRKAINGAIWLDNTNGVFPDWIEVDFNGTKTISEIDVVTQQDDNLNPVEPTVPQTFNNWGITAFDVQYWNGSSWITVPGGTVSGNNRVWRQFTFAAVTTSKIRVVVNDGMDHIFSRVVEVEAWGTNAPADSGGVDLQWLVTDQLGTPRMIFDKTGSLANTKRHDYLPFGEELPAGTGARMMAHGYSVNDGIRQKFTQKERDTETGLDYFLARHYASTYGRFTSPDPLLASGRPANPQTWNRYAYVLNNPLRFVDPNGLAVGSDMSVADFQAQPLSQPPAGQQPPAPAPTPQPQAITPKIPLTDITFATTLDPLNPSASVPLGAAANAVLNKAVTLMANNDLSAMMIVKEMEQHPELSKSDAIGLSLHISQDPSVELSGTSTVYVRSVDSALLETGIANAGIQGATAQTLFPMISPIAGAPGDCTARIGDMVTPNGGNLAAAFADLARSQAQEVARATYQRLYSANPSESLPH